MFNLFEEFVKDRSREGDPADSAFTGAAGGAACGDLSRISITVDQTGPETVIDQVTFGTEGCSAARAASALVAEMVDGLSVLDAARITADQVDRELGGLTPAMKHGPMLAVDALHRALSNAVSSGIKLSDPVENRVMVAVSGGVDSAVAALQERDRGADVVAVTVKLWADEKTDGAKACCSPEAVLGARAVTHSMGMPHFTLDLEGTFRKKVVGSFLSGYANGTTPNPCILCNGDVRIDAMVQFALRSGAEKLITGHYAKKIEDDYGYLIAEGDDPGKDQSYMLSGLSPETVARLDFPLASLTKSEVRAIAADHELAVAKKPESQDLCFLAGQNKADFLERHGGLADLPGDIISVDGEILGQHRGFHHFTVGQRRGLGVASSEPLYVTGVDPVKNTVTVGTRDQLEKRTVHLRNVTLHRDGNTVDRVRLRYRSPALPTSVTAAKGSHQELQITLGVPFAGVTPGQTAVLMSGSKVVGHGLIV